MPARDMAAYMRKRRARLKAEQGLAPRKPGRPKAAPRPAAIPLGRALTAKERLDDAEMERIERNGGRPEWDNTQNRWRDAAAPPARAVVIAPPAPCSMVAIGGKPGRGLVPQGPGYAAPPDIAAGSQFTRFQENTAAMLAALAARADAQDREIAALKAAVADRRAVAADLVQAFFNAVRYAAIGRT
jgi:hypothetical protein